MSFCHQGKRHDSKPPIPNVAKLTLNVAHWAAIRRRFSHSQAHEILRQSKILLNIFTTIFDRGSLLKSQYSLIEIRFSPANKKNLKPRLSMYASPKINLEDKQRRTSPYFVSFSIHCNHCPLCFNGPIQIQSYHISEAN